MAFNNYIIYSTISNTESGKSNAEEKMKEILKKFDSLEDYDGAKEYVENDLGIKSPCSKHPINEKVSLNYEHDNGVLSIEIICNKEHSVYCYRK